MWVNKFQGLCLINGKGFILGKCMNQTNRAIALDPDHMSFCWNLIKDVNTSWLKRKLKYFGKRKHFLYIQEETVRHKYTEVNKNKLWHDIMNNLYFDKNKIKWNKVIK